MRQAREAQPVFETIATDGQTRPLEFEDVDEGVRVPRFGSDDLLYIADYAAAAGYLLDGFFLAGRHGSTLDEHEQAEISAGILEHLHSSDARFAAATLAKDFPGYYVTGVRLTTPEMHTVILRRLGVVETDDPSAVVSFLAAAWKKVHFQ